MRLDISPPANAYEVVTKRWGLQNPKQIKKNYRSTVYFVESPQGPAKLKIYTQIGYRGERPAISYTKGVDSKFIAQIYQSDFYRAAVLSEWVEGPPVSETWRKGDYEKATRLACEVIHGLTESSRVSFPFAYRRKTVNRYRSLQGELKRSQSSEQRALVVEAMGILERFLMLRSSERVIHGDLHYDNIIQTTHGARAIDPRGVNAHPITNCSSLFFDTATDVDPPVLGEVFSDQVKVITEYLGYDRDLLMQYALFTWLWRTIKRDENDHAFREKRLREVDTIRGVIAQT
ncbi:aminoglycoside phosphotransferase family protein [Loktanella agnita]|uniref:aminoglycoside phosphotransferase family protein n=1 Tax=Loktanella agnita TaxID=287097 RepID=UPI003985EFD8